MLKIIPFLFIFLYAQEWFITNYEYGKMLYTNPRGINCTKCHGKKGEGKIITHYINKNEEVIAIRTKNIQNISFKRLKKALFHKINVKKELKKNPHSLIKYINIMPIYNYLTDSEIKAIILYLRKSKDENESTNIRDINKTK
jgi:hypothetical protein